MRYACVWLVSLLVLSFAKPLVPLQGEPGETKLLAFSEGGRVELPLGFTLLLPPEEVGGVTSLVVQVPNLPPGEYPIRVGEATYPFRILPKALARLRVPAPVELAWDEEAWVEVGVENVGNVPLLLSPALSPIGVVVARVQAPSRLDPGEAGTVRLLLRGQGRSGRVGIALGGALGEILVVARPSPPPPFWDWARLPSRLVVQAPHMGWYLEGGGHLPAPEGATWGQIRYRLSPNGASLDFSRGGFGVALGLSPQVLGFGLRLGLPPYALSFQGDTQGRLAVGYRFAQGGVDAGGELALLPQPGLKSAFGGYRGEVGDLGFSVRAAWQGEATRLDFSLFQKAGWRTEAFWDTQGRGGLAGYLPLGGGWHAGLGWRWDGENWVQGVLAIPLLGTVEAKADFSLTSQRLRLHLFHILNYPQEHLSEYLSWDEGSIRYGLRAATEREGLRLRGDVSLAWGQERGFSLGLGLDGTPWSLEGRLGLGADLRPTSFALSAALSFEIPLYPMPWPTLRVRLQDPEGQPVQAPVRVGNLLFRTDSQGELHLRLPPGQHTLSPTAGLAFLGLDGLVQDWRVEVKESLDLHLTVVPVRKLRLDLRFCPVEKALEGIGKVYGLPGLSPEAALNLARLVAEVGGQKFAVRPGGETLLPRGRFRLFLSGPLVGAYALGDPEGRPLGNGEFGEDWVRLCLVPLPRPVESQEVPVEQSK